MYRPSGQVDLKLALRSFSKRFSTSRSHGVLFEENMMLGAVMPWALLARPMHQVLSFMPYVALICRSVE